MCPKSSDRRFTASRDAHGPTQLLDSPQALARITVDADGTVLHTGLLAHSGATPGLKPPRGESLDRIEALLIRRALASHDWRRAQTARQLSITREGLDK